MYDRHSPRCPATAPTALPAQSCIGSHSQEALSVGWRTHFGGRWNGAGVLGPIEILLHDTLHFVWACLVDGFWVQVSPAYLRQ